MDDGRLELLVRSVRRAGVTLLASMHNSGTVSKVSAFDYGIEQDRQAERILLDSVDALGMDCLVVSEESGRYGRLDAEYQVYVDPLDGTVNYSYGIRSFCIGLAVYRNHRPLLGIIYDPGADEMFVAERGSGVTVNSERVTVGRRRAGAGNFLVNLEWFGAENFPETSARLRGAGVRARTMGSGVLALLYGVIGRGDGAVLLGNSAWDVAPGLVFAAELSCVATDVGGGPVDLGLDRLDVVAAPPAVHRRLLHGLAGG